MMRKQYIFLGVTFSFLFVILCAGSAFASKRIIRVGSTGVAGLIEQRTDGFYYGYGVEYLREIAKYTGWTYEFIPGAWRENLEDLRRGDIDLLIHVQNTEERSKQFAFSKLPSGFEYGILYTRMDNDAVFFEDFSRFNGMKIGGVQGAFYSELFADYARKHDFTYTFVSFLNANDAFAALQSGSLDAVAVSGMHAKRGYKIIGKFVPTPFFFAMGKENAALLEELDTAQAKIKERNPYFEFNLYKKFYTDTVAERQPLYTREEVTYMAGKAQFVVGCPVNSFPYSWYDPKTERVFGIYKGILDQISAQTGFSFVLRPLSLSSSPLLALEQGTFDLIVGASGFGMFPQTQRFVFSNSFIKPSICAAVRAGDVFTHEEKKTVAVSPSYQFMVEFIKREYSNFTISYEKTTEDCLQALLEGRADLVLQKSYVLQALLKKKQFKDLALVPSGITEEAVCLIAQKNIDPLVISILNKAIVALEPHTLSHLSMEYISQGKAPSTVKDFFYEHKNELLLGGIFLLLCGALFYKMRLERRRMAQLLEDKEKELTGCCARLEQAAWTKSSFFSRLSHEIRTPMNGIVGLAAIASAHSDDPDRMKESLKKITGSAKKLLTLINNILDMSSLDNKRFTITNEDFDFKQLLYSLTSLCYGQCNEKKIRFDLILSGVTEEILVGDRFRLHQILVTLFSNALEYTAPGGSIKLKVSQYEIYDHSVFIGFAITDTGTGMSPDYLANVFQPFEAREEEAQRSNGLGLSLPVTKQIVELMGGTIWVESALDKGTTFHVELPFDLPKKELRKGVHTYFNQLRLLVVDDDADSREYTSAMLHRMEIAHDCAASGREAIELLSRKVKQGTSYDLCLIDWKMPELNGFETSKRLRELVDRDTTIIICSAYDLQEMGDDAYKYGVDLCIPKPLFQSTLFNLLSNLTGGYIKQTANQSDFDFTGKRVLVAEDNIVNMEVAAGLLGLVGLVLDRASNGKEAVEAFLASAPGTYDLILMDVQMPLMDGYEATKAIRQSAHRDAQQIPILAMTAEAFSEDVSTALAAGMNDHIAKPIDTQILYTTLALYLKK